MPAAGQTSTRQQSERRPAAELAVLDSADRTNTIDAVQQALSALASRYRADEVLTCVRHIPAREAQFRPMPDWVRPELAAAYGAKGIEKLYSHQAAAAELARAGKNFVVVTPTASGKTLCYNLPVLNARAGESGHARALSLPHQGAGAGPARRTARSGQAARRLLRRVHLRRRHAERRAQGDSRARARRCCRTRTCCTRGILPHHTKWMRLFENLRYIVLDELHTYRGVFGSHLANVLRRLRARRAVLRLGAAVHLLLGDDCESGRAGGAADRERMSR